MKILFPILYIFFTFFFVLGSVFYKNENYPNARLFFKVSLAFEVEENGQVYNNIAHTFYREKSYDQAVENFLLALDQIEQSGIDPLKSEIQYNLANAYFRLGENYLENDDKEQVATNWLLAIDYYEQALVIDPSDKHTEENLEYVKKLLQELQDEKDDPSKSKEDSKEKEVNKQEILEREAENKETQNERRQLYDYDGEYRDYDKPGW